MPEKYKNNVQLYNDWCHVVSAVIREGSVYWALYQTGFRRKLPAFLLVLAQILMHSMSEACEKKSWNITHSLQNILKNKWGLFSQYMIFSAYKSFRAVDEIQWEKS